MSHFFRSWTFTLALSCSAAATAPQFQADEVLPHQSTFASGNGTTSIPFGASNPLRVLYAYGRDTIDPQTPVEIEGVYFRVDESAAAYSRSTYQMSLDVSTGRRAEDNLSRTFDENHGADRVRVFDGSLVARGRSTITRPGPTLAFVPFNETFLWDPRSGPLLLDFRHRGITSGSGVNADTSTSHAAYRIANQVDANGTTATFPATGSQRTGLVIGLDLACVSSAAASSNRTNTSLPWNRPAGSAMRIQYVYDALPTPTNELITRLQWAVANGTWSGLRSFDVTVSLSTGAPGLSNAMSTVFADNHGADRTIVYDGNVRFDSTPPPIPLLPQPFNQVLELQVPFEYSPARGSLVVDIQMHRANNPAETNFQAEIARPGIARLSNGTSSTARSGSLTDDVALIMCVAGVPNEIVPPTHDGRPGASSSSLPWNAQTSQRAMFLYDPTLFASGPRTITHLSWRPNENTGAFGGVVYNARINLSTSSRTVATASTTFSQNHGPDLEQVFDGDISVPYRPRSGSPADWAIVVKLDRPFRYDGGGPLVVDIQKNTGYVAGSPGQQFDGALMPGRAVRLVHRTNRFATTADLGPTEFGLSLRLGGYGANGQVIPAGRGCLGQNGELVGSTQGLPFVGNRRFAFSLYHGPSNRACAMLLGSASRNVRWESSARRLAACSSVESADRSRP